MEVSARTRSSYDCGAHQPDLDNLMSAVREIRSRPEHDRLPPAEARPLNREERREVQRQTEGFTPKLDAHALKWVDPPYKGMEVTLTSLEVGAFLNLARMALTFRGASEESLSVDQLDHLERFFGMIGDGIIEWNVNHPKTGERLPADAEGVRRLGLTIAMEIADQWMRGVGHVSDPLPQPSNDGKRLEEVSLPMATLSEPPRS